jgi:hypothetical protein
VHIDAKREESAGTGCFDIWRAAGNGFGPKEPTFLVPSPSASLLGILRLELAGL